jgi:hypothetical protein
MGKIIRGRLSVEPATMKLYSVETIFVREVSADRDHFE